MTFRNSYFRTAFVISQAIRSIQLSFLNNCFAVRVKPSSKLRLRPLGIVITGTGKSSSRINGAARISNGRIIGARSRDVIALIVKRTLGLPAVSTNALLSGDSFVIVAELTTEVETAKIKRIVNAVTSLGNVGGIAMFKTIIHLC